MPFLRSCIWVYLYLICQNLNGHDVVFW
uniref:Uncharacterized protein n=1 Tax=Rhizophora mucronata TaxID=61149 RepID=A0A2P2N5Q6_RHIMU